MHPSLVQALTFLQGEKLFDSLGIYITVNYSHNCNGYLVQFSFLVRSR